MVESVPRPQLQQEADYPNKCERCGKRVRSSLCHCDRTGQDTCVKCMLEVNFEHIGTLGSGNTSKDKGVVVGTFRTK